MSEQGQEAKSLTQRIEDLLTAKPYLKLDEMRAQLRVDKRVLLDCLEENGHKYNTPELAARAPGHRWRSAPCLGEPYFPKRFWLPSQPPPATLQAQRLPPGQSSALSFYLVHFLCVKTEGRARDSVGECTVGKMAHQAFPNVSPPNIPFLIHIFK